MIPYEVCKTGVKSSKDDSRLSKNCLIGGTEKHHVRKEKKNDMKCTSVITSQT